MSTEILNNLGSLTPFETHTVRELAELKTDMKALVGNGQPGRVTVLEKRLFKLIIAVAVIAALAFGPTILTWALGF